MGRKDTGVKIPFLEKDNCFHWKVKIHLHLMSIDEDYVRCIENDPYVPMKPVTSPTGKERAIPKPVTEYSPEDIEEVHKDKKILNILFNGLDRYMLQCHKMHYYKRSLGHYPNFM